MSWNQLAVILDDRRKTVAEERREPLVSCPVCGHQLEYNAKKGLLACPFDDFSQSGRLPSG